MGEKLKPSTHSRPALRADVRARGSESEATDASSAKPNGVPPAAPLPSPRHPPAISDAFESRYGVRDTTARVQLQPAHQPFGLTKPAGAAVSARGGHKRAVQIAKSAGAAIAQAVLGISEAVWRTPEAAERWLKYVESLGVRVGIPEEVIRAVLPIDATGWLVHGVDLGGRHWAGTSDVANGIAEAQQILPEHVEAFDRVSAKAAAADAALEEALKHNNFEPLEHILSDTEAWCAFLGQAAPSLYLALKSGGSLAFLAWLEGMEVASDAAEFEKTTGQRVSEPEFARSSLQVALINALLERTGVEAILGPKGGGSLFKVLSQHVAAAAAEGGTEGLQALNTNLAAFLSYDRQRNLLQGVLPGMMGGFGAGGATNLGQPVRSNARKAAGAIRHAGSIAQLKAVWNAKLKQAVPKRPGKIFDQAEFPNYFLPPQYWGRPVEQVPRGILTSSRKLLEAALTSRFRRMTVAVSEDGSAPKHVHIFEYLQEQLEQIDPGVEVRPAGGVVRSLIAQVYAEIHEGMTRSPPVSPVATLQRIASEQTDVPAHKVYGGGSDFDLHLEVTDQDKLGQLRERTRDIINSNLHRYKIRTGKNDFNRSLTAVADVTESDEHHRRTKRYGGSTIDWLELDWRGGKLIEPQGKPGIIDKLITGVYEYAPPSSSSPPSAWELAVTAVRGGRAGLELPFLRLEDESVLAAQLDRLQNSLQAGEPVNEKVPKQVAKMVRNASLAGANNRYRRAAPNSLDEKYFGIADALHDGNGPHLLPEFADRRPLTQRSGSKEELNGLPRSLLLPVSAFIEEYTAGGTGALYHGTPEIDSSLAIMRQGLIVSSHETGLTAVMGRGAYATAEEGLASVYAGSEGIVFKIQVKNDPRVNILVWNNEVENSAFIKSLEQKHGLRGEELFDILQREHGIDIIVNDHTLVQNVDAVDIPTDFRSLADAFGGLVLNSSAAIAQRLQALASYANLAAYAHDLGETVRSPDELRAHLVEEQRSCFEDRQSDLRTRFSAASSLQELGELTTEDVATLLDDVISGLQSASSTRQEETVATLEHDNNIELLIETAPHNPQIEVLLLHLTKRPSARKMAIRAASHSAVPLETMSADLKERLTQAALEVLSDGYDSHAINYLEAHASEHLPDILRRLYAQTSMFAQEHVLKMAARMYRRDGQMLDLLLEGLDASPSWVARVAIEALGNLRDLPTAQLIGLADGQKHTAYAVEALAERMVDPLAREYVLAKAREALGREPSSTAVNAAEAICKTDGRDPEIARIVLQLAVHPVPFLSQSAKKALRRLVLPEDVVVSFVRDVFDRGEARAQRDIALELAKVSPESLELQRLLLDKALDPETPWWMRQQLVEALSGMRVTDATFTSDLAQVLLAGDDRDATIGAAAALTAAASYNTQAKKAVFDFVEQVASRDNPAYEYHEAKSAIAALGLNPAPALREKTVDYLTDYLEQDAADGKFSALVGDLVTALLAHATHTQRLGKLFRAVLESEAYLPSETEERLESMLRSDD